MSTPGGLCSLLCKVSTLSTPQMNHLTHPKNKEHRDSQGKITQTNEEVLWILYYHLTTTLSVITGDSRCRKKMQLILLPWHVHRRLPTPFKDLKHVRQPRSHESSQGVGRIPCWQCFNNILIESAENDDDMQSQRSILLMFQVQLSI